MGKLLRMTGMVLLAALAGPVFALGLGQIEVKSRPGQPLVAEIPIISSDPAELQGLQVGLASPETFQRIGLQPPRGIVSDLQFTPAMDARGRPVIRVTTQAPVQQPLLTFLVVVDWGQGRLVREYSALVDAPGTVAAQAQPPIQAPVGAPANTIVRPVESPVASEPVPAPVPQRVEPAPVVPPAPPAPIAAIPLPPPVAVAPAPAAAMAAESNEYGPVRPGDTLGEIAGQLDATRGYTLDQTMLGLLRANPAAFIGDDINRLRQGAVLRIPRADELSRYSATEAAAVVREQIARWREARQPQVQPAAQASAPSSAPAATSADRGRRVAGARLEIVPPSSADARRAGTRSGINAGGEGEMLRQELQQTKETLAARDAEVEELKTRLAELEQLQQQQQQLITLKDSELAAAQQRLAASNARQAATADTPAPAATTTARPVAPAAETPGREAIGWAWVVPLLLVLGAIGWWWSRRRRSPPTPVRTFDTAALAAGMPNAEPETATPRGPEIPPDAVITAPEEGLPMWTTHAKPAPSVPAAVPPLPATREPTWHGGPVSADTVAPLNQAPAGHERIELARAYLDLGDRVTARSLLQEVVDSGDAVAREEASQLLRGLA